MQKKKKKSVDFIIIGYSNELACGYISKCGPRKSKEKIHVDVHQRFWPQHFISKIPSASLLARAVRQQFGLFLDL